MSFTSEDMLHSLWWDSTYQFHAPQDLGTDGCYRMVSAFKTTSFSRERRCPVPIGRGLSDSALGGRLTSFLIGAEAIKNATLELFESLMRLYHARLQRRRVAIPHRCQSLEQATPVNVQGINSSLPWLSSHANRKAVWSWGFPPIQLMNMEARLHSLQYPISQIPSWNALDDSR